jgi:glucan phosphorylase
MLEVDEIDKAEILSRKLTQKIHSQNQLSEQSLKQQFFLVSAAMQDMLENFKK